NRQELPWQMLNLAGVGFASSSLATRCSSRLWQAARTKAMEIRPRAGRWRGSMAIRIAKGGEESRLRAYAIEAALRSVDGGPLIRIAVVGAIGDTASMQTQTPKFWFVVSVAATAMLLWPGRSGHAESSSRGAEIKQVVYMYGVTEYCGLNTMEVYDGYRREIRHLTRKGRLPESTVRWLRIHGMLAADLEYDDRGLGGFRQWYPTQPIHSARPILPFLH